MTLAIATAVFEDGEGIADAYVASFHPDKLQQVIFPWMSDFMHRWPFNHAKPDGVFLKVTYTETGQIVSFSRWHFLNMPKAKGEKERDAKKVADMKRE